MRLTNDQRAAVEVDAAIVARDFHAARTPAYEQLRHAVERLLLGFLALDGDGRAEAVIALSSLAARPAIRRGPIVSVRRAEGLGRWKARVTTAPYQSEERCVPVLDGELFRFDSREERERWCQLWSDLRSPDYVSFDRSADRCAHDGQIFEPHARAEGGAR